MARSDAIRDDFLSQIMIVRDDIRDKFLKAHQVLQDRETDLLAKLQELEDEFFEDGIIKQIKELEMSKESLMDTIVGNENKEILELSIANINTRIDTLKHKLQSVKDTFKSVTLDWDAELEDKLSLTGDMQINGVAQKQVRDYKKIEIPEASFGKHVIRTSSSPGVFCFPGSITIDPTSNYTYICDGGNNRVQVFNKSFNFVFLFSGKMDGPSGICINSNKVFVTQFRSNLLTVYSVKGKYLQSVGRKGKYKLQFEIPCGLDISSEMNRIYIAEFGNHRVHCLKFDLSFHSFIDDTLGTRDVKLTPEEIIVLTSRNPCVSIYSYSHQLIRRMIPRGESCQLKLPVRFVLDKSYNIIITDYSSHCIYVYSYREKFVHKFGKQGDHEGGLIDPIGIAIFPQGWIIVASTNPNHPIQIF